MAAPDNWEQFNEDMRQWQQQAQDLALTYRGLVDVAASGELGALAFIESLSEAPIGDRAALQQTLQVQNVAGRGVVGGSGGLMAQGAFGLGGQGTTPPNDDLLLDADNGIYRLTSSNTGVDSASGDILIRGKFGSNNNNRLLLLGAGPLISPVLRLRVQSAFGGWGDTATFFHNQNILGTVRMTDGTPTGGIIEQGSNSNGEWLKLADGTYRVICSTSAAAVGGNISSVEPVRALPVEYSSFVSTPKLMISASFRNYEEAGLPVEARCVSLHGELLSDTSECRFVADFNPSLSRSRNEAYELTIILEGRWY